MKDLTHLEALLLEAIVKLHPLKCTSVLLLPLNTAEKAIRFSDLVNPLKSNMGIYAPKADSAMLQLDKSMLMGTSITPATHRLTFSGRLQQQHLQPLHRLHQSALCKSRRSRKWDANAFCQHSAKASKSTCRLLLSHDWNLPLFLSSYSPAI